MIKNSASSTKSICCKPNLYGGRKSSHDSGLHRQYACQKSSEYPSPAPYLSFFCNICATPSCCAQLHPRSPCVWWFIWGHVRSPCFEWLLDNESPWWFADMAKYRFLTKWSSNNVWRHSASWRDGLDYQWSTDRLRRRLYGTWDSHSCFFG